MTPYAERLIPIEDQVIFHKIREAILRLPDIDLGLDQDDRPIMLSCHILARAVARVFSIRVCDGHFTTGFEHSWLQTANGHIIDVYPVAVIGGPIMFDGSYFSPQRNIYKKIQTKKISRGRFSQPWFRRSVSRITRALQKTII